uniref:Uncharacterized protein n=1 Tax=Arundo donax TaxID=35708 RepID=A0A0A9AXY1_ARUDO
MLVLYLHCNMFYFCIMVIALPK